jgi:hypothetical protein
MKVIAISSRRPGVTPDKAHAFQKDEARRVWELYASDKVREIYFRRDRPGGVLVLECTNVEEAREILGTLPMVQAGLTEFEIIPVGPYDRWSVLFA